MKEDIIKEIELLTNILAAWSWLKYDDITYDSDRENQKRKILDRLNKLIELGLE